MVLLPKKTTTIDNTEMIVGKFAYKNPVRLLLAVSSTSSTVEGRRRWV